MPDNHHEETWIIGRLGYEDAFFKPHKTLNPRGAYMFVYDSAYENMIFTWLVLNSDV